ncbi:hypothetical protein Tco_1176836 [Tanacetum coccineum]
MSSPNHSTSDIEDAFSSMNILNYTLVSSDYFPASSGSSSFNSSKNSIDNMIPPVFSPFYNNPCLKDVQACYSKESPISPPDPITLTTILTPSLKIVEGRINDRMVIRRNGNELKTELKRIRTQIIKLQKKQLGQRDKITFAHYRISNLEQIMEEIQARHQTDQEDL